MSNFAKEIIPVNLEDEMKQSYLDYAMSVIVGRALPDVRDGLKPVHRRVLFAMSEENNDWNKAHKKSARIVGSVIGKYHPHGDTAVYETMVRMAQPFSMRHMLIDGQGNFGCFTGDTKIKLLDGTEKSFTELAELPDDEIFHVYSTDKTGKIVVGEGRYSRITRKNAELVELTLDSAEKIRCTPDHRFLLRDGTYKQAQFLTIDDSLMAGRFDTAPVKEGLNDYLRIYQTTTQQYEFVHCVADKFNEVQGLTAPRNGAFVRHHKNFNRFDNRPTNIERLDFLEHLHLHAEHIAELWLDDDFRQKQREGVQAYYAANPDVIEARRNRFVLQNKNPIFRKENGLRIAKTLKQRFADNPALCEEISVRMKALWQDSDYREKMKLALADVEKRPLSPEEKQRVAQIISEKSRAMWQDDEKRAEISMAIAQSLASPEVRQKISENTRRLWQDENYRANYGDDHFSKMAKTYWAKPESRAYHSEKLTKQRESEEFCAAQVEGVQKSNAQRLQDNPEMMQELNAKAVISLQENWKNSDYKKQVMTQKIARYGSKLVTEFGIEQLTPELYETQRDANWIPRLTTALNYFQDFSELKHAAQNYNHRVVEVRWLQETADVYDITVDEHHNFLLADGVFVHNSVDGDSPAAMRYTEVRMARIAHEMLTDLDKETVDFSPNYDESEFEPVVLPTRIPTLLINGSSGIAVGMATNIPPHNLSEVISACLALIDEPNSTISDLMEHIKGPDFPTAAFINGAAGIRHAYETGRGKIYLRAKTHFENIGEGSRQAIITTELPYQVNKARLLEKIAELVKEGKLEGISGLRDESDKDGMRMVVELKRGEVAEVVLNNLYKQTQFQTVFGINMVAILDGRPFCLNLLEILNAFINHRREIVTRRTVYLLRKARERAHILEGLAIALANINAMIDMIKAAKNPAEAKEQLLTTQWAAGLVLSLIERTNAGDSRPDNLPAIYGLTGNVYRLSEAQAQAILELRLHRLTGLEQDKIVGEYTQLLEQIAFYLHILGDDLRLMAVIREELVTIKEQYNEPRRTIIMENRDDLSDEDLITEEDMVVTVSHEGYVKAQPLSDYQAQHRGGRGKSATQTKEEDFVDQLIIANTHDTILCFSSKGKVYALKVYHLPIGSRAARGKPFVNLLPLEEGEKINAFLPTRDYDENKFVFMATSAGTVKKTPLSEFAYQRVSGKIAIDLREDDTLIGVAITDGQQNVMLFSSNGKAIRFNEADVRSMGRTATGVRGLRLTEGENVISLIIASEGEVLTISENGYGKRTFVEKFRHQGRGGSGTIAMQTSERNGNVVGALLVNDTDELMIITDGGTLVRTRVAEISVVGRVAQGVRVIRLDVGEKVVGVDRIAGLAIDENDEVEGDEIIETTDEIIETDDVIEE